MDPEASSRAKRGTWPACLGRLYHVPIQASKVPRFTRDEARASLRMTANYYPALTRRSRTAVRPASQVPAASGWKVRQILR
jgi:hypothetical protein